MNPITNEATFQHNNPHAPTLREINGKIYTLFSWKHQEEIPPEYRRNEPPPPGHSKVLKIAKAANESIVARLVATDNEDPMSHRMLRHTTQITNGYRIAQELAGTPGILEHYELAIERRKTKPGWKVELYTKYYPQDLFDRLDDVQHPISRSKEVRWSLKLLNALAVMHEHRIYHRDLKTENILVSADDTDIVIGDLDDCWRPDLGLGDIQRLTGTGEFIAPESQIGNQVFANRHSFEDLELNDIWAMGLVLYNILYRRDAHNKKYVKVSDLQNLPFFRIPPPPKTVERIVWDMLRLDPRKRLSARQAYQRMLTFMRA